MKYGATRRACNQISCLGVVIAIVFSCCSSRAQVQIPAGVHYKEASDAINSAASSLLTSALTGNGETPPGFFADTVTCGPSLWKVLRTSADAVLLGSKNVVVVVNGIQTEGRGLIDEQQRASFWKLLLTTYPQLRGAAIRTANPEEISYYWATIFFDIEEPFFAIDDGKETLIANFRVVDGKPRLFWIDLVTNLNRLTSGAGIPNLQVAAMMAEGGDVTAMEQLGRSYLKGNGVPADPEKAQLWLDRAAQKGSFTAKMLLGAAFMSGTGLPKDPAAACKYLLMAVDQQNVSEDEKSSLALAEYWLASFYERGAGVERSHDKAIQYLKAAAEHGNSAAEFDLGSLYNAGAGGVALARDQACHLFVEAADQGDVRAMHNAGFCYQTGAGVEKDLNLAARYYLKAAEGGSIRSEHNLAMVYGEAGDAEKAYFWLRVSQASGSDEKQPLIDTARGHLSAAQVEAEEKAVLAWLSAHPAKTAATPTPQ